MDCFGDLGLLSYGALPIVESLAIFTYAVLRVLVVLSIEPVACRRRYVFSIGVGVAPLRKPHSY